MSDFLNPYAGGPVPRPSVDSKSIDELFSPYRIECHIEPRRRGLAMPKQSADRFRTLVLQLGEKWAYLRWRRAEMPKSVADVLAHYRQQILTLKRDESWSSYLESDLIAEYSANDEKLKQLFGYDLYNDFLYNIEETV